MCTARSFDLTHGLVAGRIPASRATPEIHPHAPLPDRHIILSDWSIGDMSNMNCGVTGRHQHKQMKMIAITLAALTGLAAAADTSPTLESAAKRAQTEISIATGATVSKATLAMDAAKAMSKRVKKAAAPVVAAVSAEADKVKTSAQAEAPAVINKVSAYKVSEQLMVQQVLGAATRVVEAVAQEQR